MAEGVGWLAKIVEILRTFFSITKRVVDAVRWVDLVFFVSLLYLTGVLNTCLFKLPAKHQALLYSFIEWYAVFYAVALSVILAEAWKRLSKINSDIDREADALKQLLHTAKLFRGKNLYKRLLTRVYEYADEVLALKFKDKRLETKSYELLQSIRKCVDNMLVGGKGKAVKAPEFLKADLMRHYFDACDARGDRFDQIGQRLPKYVWFLLAVFSLVWFWGFLWLEFHDDCTSLKWYILGATTFSMSLLFYTARSLSDPTKGSWKISFDSFRTIFM